MLERRFGHCRNGWNASGSDGGHGCCQQRGENAGNHRDENGARCDDEASRRHTEAELVEYHLNANGKAGSGEQAYQRAEQSDDGCLDQHHPGHLSATGSDGAKQRIFAATLCRSNREHVVDHEATNSEGNERKDRQEDGEEAKTLLHFGLALSSDLRAGERLLNALRQCRVGQRAIAAHQHGVDEAGLSDELHCGLVIEQCPCGITRCRDVVVLRKANKCE